MKRYCVSLVIKFIKPTGVMSIFNCVNTKVMANKEEEAFGKYYKDVKVTYPDYDLHTHLVIEIL